jgi:hypothetical protein
MIKIEINKINDIEIKRYYSETHYIKKEGSEELLNEILVGVNENVEVFETDVEIRIIDLEKKEKIERILNDRRNYTVL